jgi:hypothetical protein
MKLTTKIAITALLIWLFVIPKITSFNDTFEEKFCKSYGNWVKYSWAVQNQYSDNWQSLSDNEYTNLQKLVNRDLPTGSNYIKRVANEWFRASEAGDYSTGSAMGAVLFVECKKYGVKIDKKYLAK